MFRSLRCVDPRSRQVVLVAMLLAVPAVVGRGADHAQDEAAIRAAAESYRAALERGDTKALAGLWTEDGDIVDADGAVLPGRETVAVEGPRPAGQERPRIEMGETSLRFVADDVAIEDGSVKVTVPDMPTPFIGRFSATWVRQDGTWKIAAVRESRGDVGTGDERLQDLEWMVGNWTVVEERPENAPPSPAAIDMKVRWNPEKTFLLRDVHIHPRDSDTGGIHITQRIGWDPLSRRIRSWVFSSDGGHGEATWSRDGATWVARTLSVMPDGSQTATINIYAYDGADRCTWRSLPTHAGGEHTPPITMTMTRVPAKESP